MVKGKKDIRKLIDLPEKTVKGLEKIVEAERMTVKPYIEKIIIEHEARKNRKK